jgi:hypothetical protein
LSIDSKSTAFSDIFSDDLFGSPNPDGQSAYTSPRLSGSPDLKSNPPYDDNDPEKLAKQDPLYTQIWKMYARQKQSLPHAQRMENLSWRMMGLVLKKKEDAASKGEVKSEAATTPAPTQSDEEERGRRIDKGKGKVQVVGFDGTNQDGAEDDELVLIHYVMPNLYLSHHPVSLLWTGEP